MQHKFRLTGFSIVSKRFEMIRNNVFHAANVLENTLTFCLFFREFNLEKDSRGAEENYKSNFKYYESCAAEFEETLGIQQGSELECSNMDGAPYLCKATIWKIGDCTLDLSYKGLGLEYGISITAHIIYNDKLTEV